MVKQEIQSPAISVVIPCRNERDHIEDCLGSVLAQQPPPGDFEVIVADGMSDDGTRRILMRIAKGYPRLRIIDNPVRNAAAGLNAAIRASRGRIIARMDAHTEYAPDYLAQCLQVLQESGADNVGGPARTKSTGYVQSVICAAYHSPFAVGGARFHNVGYEGYVDTVTYGCWRREIFDLIGFFDEELVRNQDDEFNLRLRRYGGKIWQSPRIRSWYRPRTSVIGLFRQYSQYGYWKVRVIQKHKVPSSVRHLIPGSFILSLVLLALASPWSTLAAWSGTGLVGLYAVCNVGASFFTAARAGWTLFPLLPVVFGCYHFGYGYGCLRGLWDFVIFPRGPNKFYTRLTRNSAENSSRPRTAN